MDWVLCMWAVYVTLTPLLAMAQVSYSRQALLDLRQVSHKQQIDLPTLLLLRKLNICAKRPTHRGKGSQTALNNLTHLCMLNCQSVCNKTELVMDYITDMNVDIMGLTETWLCEGDKHSGVIADLTHNGYDIVHTPRPTHGGGVAILYKQAYKQAYVFLSQISRLTHLKMWLVNYTMVKK